MATYVLVIACCDCQADCNLKRILELRLQLQGLQPDASVGIETELKDGAPGECDVEFKESVAG